MTAAALTKARYIGSLIIENIPPARRGEPEIQLSIGLDADGELDAEASDAATGESQKFAISLKTLSDEEIYEVPEFRWKRSSRRARRQRKSRQPRKPKRLRRTARQTSKGWMPSRRPGSPQKLRHHGIPGSSGAPEPEEFDFEEPPLTGESYPVGAGGRQKERASRRGPGAFLVILFCLLGALLLGVVGYVVYRAVTGQPVQLLPGTESPASLESPATGESAAAAQSSSTGSSEKLAVTDMPDTPAATDTPAASDTPAATDTPAAPAKRAGVSYRIRKGDTLWDISATYYRNPWLYLRLARANSIRNPDLIFAGEKLFIPED